MFKSTTQPKLPTWNSFKKETLVNEQTYQACISRVLWSEEWKSITFVTESFRYTVKFETKEAYDEAYETLRNGEVTPHLCYFTWEATTDEADVVFNPIKDADSAAELNEFLLGMVIKFRSFPWGLVSDLAKLPQPKPEDRKRRSGRFSTPAGE